MSIRDDEFEIMTSQRLEANRPFIIAEQSLARAALGDLYYEGVYDREADLNASSKLVNAIHNVYYNLHLNNGGNDLILPGRKGQPGFTVSLNELSVDDFNPHKKLIVSRPLRTYAHVVDYIQVKPENDLAYVTRCLIPVLKTAKKQEIDSVIVGPIRASHEHINIAIQALHNGLQEHAEGRNILFANRDVTGNTVAF